jgi:hypothetical protein
MQQIEDRALFLMRKHAIDGRYGFRWNKRTTSYGLCRYPFHSEQGWIELSRVLVPGLDEKAITEILLHEIAHALTPGSKHGPLWQQVCRGIGGNGKRTASYRSAAQVHAGAKWGLFYKDRLIKPYTRKPGPAMFNKVRFMYVPSIGMTETMGQLEIRQITQG